MKTLEALSPEQYMRVSHRLLHPAPGTRAESATKSGIDLTLLVEQLRPTPAERAKKLESAVTAAGQIRGIARRNS